MIETSDMQFEERMVTPREVEEDREAEVTLVRKRWWNISDRIKSRKIWQSISRQPSGVATLWITCCCTGLRDWERRPCPRSLPTKWA